MHPRNEKRRPCKGRRSQKGSLMASTIIIQPIARVTPRRRQRGQESTIRASMTVAELRRLADGYERDARKAARNGVPLAAEAANDRAAYLRNRAAAGGAQ